MSFYAHSENAVGQCHALSEHLQCVARLASDASGAASWRAEAELAGLMHDLGKYGDLFQRRLEGKESGLDHWSAGAVLAATDPALRAAAAALAIEGHHIGLQAATPSAIKSRLRLEKLTKNHPQGLKLSDADFARLRIRAEADGLAWVAPESRIFQKPGDFEHAVAAMLDVRLLFSCLVDADYLDTDAHFRATPAGKHYREAGPALTVDTALAALDSHMAQAVRKASRSSEDVSEVRAQLWQAVEKAAIGDTGLFTLTAPTGSGKTLAMLKFALEHAKRNGLRRVVLAVPYLSIIEQTAREYRRVFCNQPQHFVLEHHSLAGLGPEKTRGDSEENKKDDTERQRQLLSENWDAPIVLTTNVQLLESLFSNRPAACRKLHRLMESVILFDEAQSLPQPLTVPTLAALSHLSAKYRSSVVFATATQPAFDHLDTAVKAHAVSGWKPVEIVTGHASMFDRLRRVEVEWPQRDQHLGWSALADRLRQQTQVLCVVNLKRHAQLLTEALGDDPNLFHLSTNLCTRHRREVLDEVRERLVKGKPCKLVSTQCVEAGVDIDFPVVYRALAPLEAIAQAAGRCNREGRTGRGSVVVFETEDDDTAGASTRDAWRGRYPSFAYWQATEQTRTMLRPSGSVDICDPAAFREYYRQLFDLSRPEHQNPELKLAIDELDFPEIARLYRLIEQDAIQVVVPWSQRIDEYEALRKQAISGIDREWMTRAQSLAVAVYRPRQDHAVWSWLMPAKFPPRRGRGGDSDEWFVLEDNYHKDPARRLYDDTLGLRLPDSQRIYIS